MKKILVIASTFPKNDNDSTPAFVYNLTKLIENSSIQIIVPQSKGALKYQKYNNIKIKRFTFWPFQTVITDGPIIENIKKHPIRIIQFPLFITIYFIKIITHIIKQKPDIIIAHWIIPQGVLAVLAKKITFSKKIKIVSHIHGVDIFGLKKFNFLKKWVLKNSDKVIVHSMAVKEETKKIFAKARIHYVPYSIDTDFFNSNTNEKRENSIVFIGRLSEKKGVIYLLKAMKYIIKDFPDIKLNIIGDGERKEELVNYVKKNNLSKNIIFQGSLSHDKILPFLKNSKIFIAPSIVTKSGDQEGFGIVFAEALSTKCAVIATDLPAMRDTIIDKKTGLIIKQKDPNDIYKKIKMLLSNDKLRTKLSNNGRIHIVNNFSIIISKTLYNKVFK